MQRHRNHRAIPRGITDHLEGIPEEGNEKGWRGGVSTGNEQALMIHTGGIPSSTDAVDQALPYRITCGFVVWHGCLACEQICTSEVMQDADGRITIASVADCALRHARKAVNVV
jgi:hypothetical protein